LGLKEMKRLAAMKGQAEEDECYAQEYRDRLAQEHAILEERRRRSLEVAAGFRQQRDEKITRQRAERAVAREDEQVLADHARLEAEQERAVAAGQRQRERELREANIRENAAIARFRERMRELEALEDQRIRDAAVRQMDDEEERREEDAKRKRDRLLARERLIDAERQRQIRALTVEEDFLDRQLDQQHQKEQDEIARTVARRDRLARERRSDFLDSLRLREQKERERRERRFARRPFPARENNQTDDRSTERAIQKVRNESDMRQFQLNQMMEKKEREAAERERERLEFDHERQKEQHDLQVAQEYARKLLADAATHDGNPPES
jgi:hypothetical protein